jgi:hypothetical protein
MWKEATTSRFDEMYPNVPAGTEENHKTFSQSNVFPGKVWTQELPNLKRKCHQLNHSIRLSFLSPLIATPRGCEFLKWEWFELNSPMRSQRRTESFLSQSSVVSYVERLATENVTAHPCLTSHWLKNIGLVRWVSTAPDWANCKFSHCRKSVSSVACAC